MEKLPLTQWELAAIEQGLRLLQDREIYTAPLVKNQLKMLIDRITNSRSDEVERPIKMGKYRRTKGAREAALA